MDVNVHQIDNELKWVCFIFINFQCGKWDILVIYIFYEEFQFPPVFQSETDEK